MDTGNGFRVTTKDVWNEVEGVKKSLNEIHNTLATITESLSNLDDVKSAAYEARRAVKTHESDIKELQDDRRWLWRTLAGSFLLAIWSLLTGYTR